MQIDSKHIIFIAVAIGCTGCLYFLSLPPGIPFWVTAIVILTSLSFAAPLLYTGENALNETPQRTPYLFMSIAAIGAFLIINRCFYLQTKHGLWDAWSIWNLHAAYLTDPVQWKNMFRNSYMAHPDYPLALPATIAFLYRLFFFVPRLLPAFSFHFLVTLCIPLLLYTQTYRKGRITAIIILLLFATNDLYLTMGVSQLADTLLAFFFLCAFICFNAGKEQKMLVLFSAFFAGCCMWTKNEGVILGLVFILFNAKVFFSRQYFKYFLYGILLPLGCLVIFKTLYAPANDMVSGQSATTYQYLLQGTRYKTIYQSLMKLLDTDLLYFKYLIMVYAIWCIFKRRYPSLPVLMILACAVIYFMVYVVTPHDLQWHLFTSLNRLVLQLMPALVYAMVSHWQQNSTTGGSLSSKFVVIRQRPQ